MFLRSEGAKVRSARSERLKLLLMAKEANSLEEQTAVSEKLVNQD